MSKGSALVSILFAFFCGVVIGNITGTGSGGDEAVAAKDGSEATGAATGEAAKEDGVERFKVAVTAAQPSKGPADAAVTIVTISEFQCPFCARVEPRQARSEGLQGKVRLIWRNNPFRSTRTPAGREPRSSVRAGRQRQVLQAHDKLSRTSRRCRREPRRLRTGARLRLTKYKAAMDNQRTSPRSTPITALQRSSRRWHARILHHGRFCRVLSDRSLQGDSSRRAQGADKLVKSALSPRIRSTPRDQECATEKSAAAATGAAAPQQPRKLPDPKAV